MTDVVRPTKEATREYLARRTHSAEPPPTPDTVRRELGWALAEAARKTQATRNEPN